MDCKKKSAPVGSEQEQIDKLRKSLRWGQICVWIAILFHSICIARHTELIQLLIEGESRIVDLLTGILDNIDNLNAIIRSILTAIY